MVKIKSIFEEIAESVFLMNDLKAAKDFVINFVNPMPNHKLVFYFSLKDAKKLFHYSNYFNPMGTFIKNVSSSFFCASLFLGRE